MAVPRPGVFVRVAPPVLLGRPGGRWGATVERPGREVQVWHLSPRSSARAAAGGSPGVGRGRATGSRCATAPTPAVAAGSARSTTPWRQRYSICSASGPSAPRSAPPRPLDGWRRSGPKPSMPPRGRQTMPPHGRRTMPPLGRRALLPPGRRALPPPGRGALPPPGRQAMPRGGGRSWSPRGAPHDVSSHAARSSSPRTGASSTRRRPAVRCASGVSRGADPQAGRQEPSAEPYCLRKSQLAALTGSSRNHR